MHALYRRENRTGVLALLLFVGVVAFVLYWRTAVEDTPGDYHVKAGNYRLQDAQYDRAIAEFELALEANADHSLAYLGIALPHLAEQIARCDVHYAERLANQRRLCALARARCAQKNDVQGIASSIE